MESVKYRCFRYLRQFRQRKPNKSNAYAFDNFDNSGRLPNLSKYQCFRYLRQFRQINMPELPGLSKADFSNNFGNVGWCADIAGIVESRLFRQSRQCWQVCRNGQLSTIPAISADTDSAGIIEALPKMPELSEIFIFWICMSVCRRVKSILKGYSKVQALI